MNIAKRGLSALNLDQYSQLNRPEEVNSFPLFCQLERQYILRMVLKTPSYEYLKVPPELKWAGKFIANCYNYQKNVVKISHSFCYITVRHGLVESVTDDEWHVDGFSTRITHIPEQNYCWSNIYPTEYLDETFNFPRNFDPLKYNINYFFQDKIKNKLIEGFTLQKMENETVYCFDPYVVHRRPQVPAGIKRTFLRLTFSPIEIRDDNNTPNPLIPIPKYNIDGVKDFRNKLERYKL